jgi:hypothetical protein
MPEHGPLFDCLKFDSQLFISLLMIKALLLLIDPLKTWDSIARAQRGFGFVFFIFLLPMVLISAAVEGYGLVNFGRWQSGVEKLRYFTTGEAVVYEAFQALISIMIVLIAAKVLKSLGETFHGRHSYRQAFTTIAYGLSPMFLLRLLDVSSSPSLTPWTSWAIGIVLSVGAFYQGVPRVMVPDPPHAFGLYLMNSVFVLLITGLARFVTAWYLMGKFKPVDRVISEIAKQLPF